MKLRDVLIELEFQEDWTLITDEPPGYFFDFGNLLLTAAQVTSQYYQPVFYFGGVINTARKIELISIDLPLEVESFAQGVAWIAYVLGDTFEPYKPTWWVEDGRQWDEELPWVRRNKAYAARPQCNVERDWFRVAARKVRACASAGKDADVVTFRFDGKILSIDLPNELLFMPAKGQPWESDCRVQLSRLSELAKRIMAESVSLSLWEGNLIIDRCHIPYI